MGNGKVQMKKQLGLIEGTAIILGIIFGSGNNYHIFRGERICFSFVSLVSRNICFTERCNSRSKCGRDVSTHLDDMRLFVDDRCTLLCRIGNIDTSVGRWLRLYIRSIWTFSSIFIYLGCVIHFRVRIFLRFVGWKKRNPNEQIKKWTKKKIFFLCRPTTNAIMGLTFANYVLQPFFPDCAIPVEAAQLLAAATICNDRIWPYHFFTCLLIESINAFRLFNIHQLLRCQVHNETTKCVYVYENCGSSNCHNCWCCLDVTRYVQIDNDSVLESNITIKFHCLFYWQVTWKISTVHLPTQKPTQENCRLLFTPEYFHMPDGKWFQTTSTIELFNLWIFRQELFEFHDWGAQGAI